MYPFFPTLPSHPALHIMLSRVPCLVPTLECKAVCRAVCRVWAPTMLCHETEQNPLLSEQETEWLGVDPLKQQPVQWARLHPFDRGGDISLLLLQTFVRLQRASAILQCKRHKRCSWIYYLLSPAGLNKTPSYFFFVNFFLEHSCFTTLHQILLYGKVNQLSGIYTKPKLSCLKRNIHIQTMFLSAEPEIMIMLFTQAIKIMARAITISSVHTTC